MLLERGAKRTFRVQGHECKSSQKRRKIDRTAEIDLEHLTAYNNQSRKRVAAYAYLNVSLPKLAQIDV